MTSQLLDKAPVWLEEAFEERVYWCAMQYEHSPLPRNAPLTESWIYDSADAASRFCEPGVAPMSATLSDFLGIATANCRDWVVLHDGQGTELKRWPVSR